MKHNMRRIEKNIWAIYKAHNNALEPSNIKRLVRSYWKTFDKVSFPLTEEDHEKATSEESITRARRKVREELGMNDEITNQKEKEYREYYSNI